MKKLICAILIGGFLLFCSALPGYAAMGGPRSHSEFGKHGAVGKHPGFAGHSRFVRRFPGHVRHHFRRHHFRGHRPFHRHLFIGSSFLWAPFPYSAPPPVIIRQDPPVYIQQDDQSQQPYYWYYCEQSQAYYPYVQECPGGWRTVVPPPAPPAQ